MFGETNLPGTNNRVSVTNNLWSGTNNLVVCWILKRILIKLKAIIRTGHNSTLSGIVGFGSKIFSERAIVATLEKASNIRINCKILKVQYVV